MGEPVYYTSSNMPLIRLADTRGIELNKYGIDELSTSITNFINEKLQRGNPDEFVHCIWYCISGTRLEDIEINTLRKLSDIYKSNSIPIILVYTQALSKEKCISMKNFIQSTYNSNFEFIPVLAKPEIIDENYIIPIKGIDVLKEKSFLKATEAVKTSIFEHFSLQAKQEIDNHLVKLNNQLDLFIDSKIKLKLDIMNDNKNNKEICDDLKNLLFYIISNNIYIDNKKFLLTESEKYIYEFSDNFIKDSYDKIKNNYNDYINIINNEIFKYISNKKEICDIQIEDDIKNIINKFVDNKKEIFLNRIWFYFMKKKIEEICIKSINLLKDNSKDIFNSLTKEKEFEDFIDKIVRNYFEEIKNNIK